MAVLPRFSVDDLVTFSAELRGMGEGAACMAEVAQEITDYLRDNLLDEDGAPACVLVSLHKTHLLEWLPERLRALAEDTDPTADASTPCLVLLARSSSAGMPEPEAGDLVRPLTTNAYVENPIFVRLLNALGVDQRPLQDPSAALEMRMQHRELNVYVENDLASSELVVDDEGRALVDALGIESILAIGGVLPSGDLVLVSLIARTPIDDRVADLIRSLGTAAKVPLIPFTFKPFPVDA